jgi:hypothetical protein
VPRPSASRNHAAAALFSRCANLRLNAAFGIARKIGAIIQRAFFIHHGGAKPPNLKHSFPLPFLKSFPMACIVGSARLMAPNAAKPRRKTISAQQGYFPIACVQRSALSLWDLPHQARLWRFLPKVPAIPRESGTSGRHKRANEKNALPPSSGSAQ